MDPASEIHAHILQLIHTPLQKRNLNSLARALPGLLLSEKKSQNDVPKTDPEALKPRNLLELHGKHLPSKVDIVPLDPYLFSEQTWKPLELPALKSKIVEDASAIEIVESEIEWPDLTRWLRPRSEGSLSTVSISDSLCSNESTFSIPENETYQTSECPQPVKSGHTLWVGNLPQNASLDDLRNIFGTPDLQSIYLIQRTGCAFVNYNTEQSLLDAMAIFNDRGGKINNQPIVIKHQAQKKAEDSGKTSAEGSRNRYFICKSLTIDDLELARENSEWSTQIRNMPAFNQAFHTSENVYLVFSVNRTSCFYGIAKLESPFTNSTDTNANEDKEDIENVFFITPTNGYTHPDDGIEILSGRNVYDSLRGSQFWMADNCPIEESVGERFTAPASVRWLSTAENQVSFSKTKHLRNCLNQNKPIKVARDGTEIDPGVGSELLALFNI